MISSSHKKLRKGFPNEGMLINKEMERAEQRGVDIRYVSLRPPASNFRVQVFHPEYVKLKDIIGVRALNLVVDLNEL